MGKSLKGKELGKGISQRKDGLYQARFTDKLGKQKTIYAQTYKEITQKLDNEQYQEKNITLNEWYEIWFKTCKKHCRNTTLRTYSFQYNRLRESIGTIKLTDLNMVMVQNAFNALSSDSSRSDCKRLLVDILNCAMEADLINRNIAVRIKTKIDNDEKPEKRVLTEHEIQILYKASKNGSLYPFFVVALNTGMRIGEIIGLTWDCVDFERGIIRVEKTLCYLPNNGNAIYEFHPPKSRSGRRSIPMTKQVKEVLQEQKAWHDEISTKYEPKRGFEDLVFTSKTNHPLHTANIKDSINYLVKRINKQNPDIQFEYFTPHGLRHTFATNCIAKGMRPKTLQKLLGHNSLQMTMDLYCHVLDDSLKEEMAMIAEMA